ncbi:MAG: DNA primase [Hyphomicrobiales bacterium]
MAIYIPEDKVSEVRHAVDIVEIISESVQLRRAGKNLVGLCPFHAEKTPSFSVSPDKQIFYCFGCGTGGNVFSFVMKRDGTTFAEAARLLARRSGVDLPEKPLSAHEKRRISEQDSLLEINRMAADFFYRALLQPAGVKPGLDYLVRRGVTRQSIEDFQLGYAPKGWDNLLGYLTRRKFSPPLLEKGGLIVARKDGSGFYDRFRERVMFPICDENSRVVGFGGRVMDDASPKYLNSPETPVYLKRRILYGLHRAKDACRAEGTVFIVEGYLDLIALHQHGIRNAVATLGTALSPEHIRLLKRFAGHLVLVYDSDEAGIRSAQRCIDIFWKEHVDFRRGDIFREDRADTHILVLPKGHDPDSFVFQHGADDFRRLAASAPGIISFLIESAVGKHGLSTEGKIRIVSELEEPLEAINDSVARALYVQQLAERIGVPEAAVLEKLKEHRAKTAGRGMNEPAAGKAGTSAAEAGQRTEQRIISMMLQFPEINPEIVKRNILELFFDDELKAAGEVIIRQRLQSPDQLPELLARIDEGPLKKTIAALAMTEELWTVKGCKGLLNRFMETRQKQRAGQSIQKAIEAAEREQNETELLRLLNEKQKMAVRREKQKMAVLREK